jgi:hypothetical protein
MYFLSFNEGLLVLNKDVNLATTRRTGENAMQIFGKYKAGGNGRIEVPGSKTFRLHNCTIARLHDLTKNYYLGAAYE